MGGRVAVSKNSLPEGALGGRWQRALRIRVLRCLSPSQLVQASWRLTFCCSERRAGHMSYREPLSKGSWKTSHQFCHFPSHHHLSTSAAICTIPRLLITVQRKATFGLPIGRRRVECPPHSGSLTANCIPRILHGRRAKGTQSHNASTPGHLRRSFYASSDTHPTAKEQSGWPNVAVLLDANPLWRSLAAAYCAAA